MIDEAAIIGPNDETTWSPRPYRNLASSVVVKMVSLAKQGTPLAGQGLFTDYQSPEQRTNPLDASSDPILSPAG